MKPNIMKPYIIIDEDESFYAIYVGEDLGKYKNSYYFYEYIEEYDLWERHAYDKHVELDEPDKKDKIKIIQHIFEAEKWVISS